MSVLLQQPEGREAILLMFLADELAAGDRAGVEQALAREAALRAELDRLRATHEAIAAGLAALDRSTPLPVDESAAVRRAAHAMRQWAARPKPAAEPGAPAAWRMPRWAKGALGTAAAAAVVLAMVWAGGRMNPNDPRTNRPVATTPVDEAPLQIQLERTLARDREAPAFVPGTEVVIAGRDEMVFDIPLFDPADSADPEPVEP